MRGGVLGRDWKVSERERKGLMKVFIVGGFLFLMRVKTNFFLITKAEREVEILFGAGLNIEV